MGNRRTRTRSPAGATGTSTVFRAALAWMLVFVSAGCSLSRPPAKAAEPPRRFELTIRELREESVIAAKTDSVAMLRSESTLKHFGSVENVERVGAAARAGRSPEENEAAYAVFNDSLLFRSDAPFRFAALLTRDTLAVTSMGKGPSTRAPALDADREMLTCIFEGPALWVSIRESGGPAEIVDLKERCAGGLYARLNLPVTLGPFVVRVPPGLGRPGSRWETAATLPGFSGLGPSPALNMRFTIAEPSQTEGTAAGVGLSCDTTLTNVRTVTPGGGPVEIISHHIRLHGLLQTWEGLPLFHTGRISIEEDIRYVRPELESTVLEKHCRAEIVLESR